MDKTREGIPLGDALSVFNNQRKLSFNRSFFAFSLLFAFFCSSFSLSLCGSSFLFSHLFSDLFVHFFSASRRAAASAFFDSAFLACSSSGLRVFSCFHASNFCLCSSFRRMRPFLRTPPLRCFMSITPSDERMLRTVSVGCAPHSTQWRARVQNSNRLWCRIGIRIIGTNLFSVLTITWCSNVSNNNAVKGTASYAHDAAILILVAILFCCFRY